MGRKCGRKGDEMRTSFCFLVRAGLALQGDPTRLPSIMLPVFDSRLHAICELSLFFLYSALRGVSVFHSQQKQRFHWI